MLPVIQAIVSLSPPIEIAFLIASSNELLSKNAFKAGVKVIKIHDFRHSCASVLINSGASIMVVAKFLGHAKIDETLNTYSHLFETKMDEVVNTMNKLE